MSEKVETTSKERIMGNEVIDLLLDLLEHQTGIRYTYEEIKKSGDKTA